MGISLSTQFVSTNSLISSKNSLASLFVLINPSTGQLPYCGEPLCTSGNIAGLGSDTYHAWTLIGVHSYYLYSGDDAWLQEIWTNYVRL